MRHATRGGAEEQWLHVAGQILAREFDGADAQMRKSLTIGLRNIDHPAARAALARIEGAK